jgi:hypothetical protein
MDLLLVINIYVYALPLIVCEKSDEVLEYVSLVHIISSVMKLNSQWHRMNMVTVSL